MSADLPLEDPQYVWLLTAGAEEISFENQFCFLVLTINTYTPSHPGSIFANYIA